MEPILIGLLASVISGSSIGSALGALTVGNWITLGVGLATDVAPDVAKVLGSQHPTLASLVEAVMGSASKEVAAVAARAWLNANSIGAMKLQPGISSER